MCRISNVTRFLVAAGILVAGLCWAAPARAQVAPCPNPVKQPPEGSPTLLRCVQPVFHPDGTQSLDTDTLTYYLRDIEGSDSTRDRWVKYDEDAILAAFTRLWKTNFFDDLWVEVIDEPYANGTAAKHVVFHMEERARLKVVDYTGSKEVEISKIEEALKDKGITIHYDTFIDDSVIRKVAGVVKDLYAEKGYEYAKVEVERAPMPTGPKLLHLTFKITQGPKVRIREIVFDGNKDITDKTLAKQMKNNKAHTWLSFITGSGNYQEAKFDEDAQLIQDYYGDHGYAQARVGAPQLEQMGDTKDGKIRDVRLRIPVDEGQRYKIGKIDITGNTTVKSEYLRPLFKVEEGDYFSHKKLVKGYEKAKEAYGAGGFMEFTMNPELSFRGIDPETGKPIGPDPPPPIVDVTLRMTEGKQFFVHRITFVGNTTTHDTVARRDLRLYEGGIFNTEALKDSIRRINQLGYFKPLEKGENVDVQKTPNFDNQVDIKLKVEEQNRNQLAFGAGVSQFEGFFGQLSFQTSNFLGRGETVGVMLQKGVQATNYQLSFSEPYVMDRPISAGVELYTREYIYPLAYTQASTGANFTVGFPLASYTRAFLNYNYEEITVKDIDTALLTPQLLAQRPDLVDSLLINQQGRRQVSKIGPSVVYNTVNQPIFPTAGKRYTLGFSVAGTALGGNTDYLSTEAEGIWYMPISSRTSLGLRAQAEYIRPYGNTTTLPIFEKFFMGGEYSVRGFDIRSIGPRDPTSGFVTGGNKSLLFNAEYTINVGGPVRLIAFYDAGQVQDIGQAFKWFEPINQINVPAQVLPVISDPFATATVSNPFAPPFQITATQIGKASAFKTSTGLEVRFFMPVLNVPFRLISSYNPQRYGVLDNNLQPQKAFTFRFAVGTTF
jgi:outer membrane protein insertion porin family